MNKEQFINTILTNKVRRITMFQFPDYNGGFDVEAFFNLTDEKVEDILRSPYKLFKGTPSFRVERN